MTITAIEAVPFRLPPRRSFKWAGLQVDLGGFVLVRVRTASGIVGYGEATPLPDWGGDHGRRGGETQATVVSVIEEVLAPALIGRDACDVESAYALMNARLRGHSYAKCAVDIALHDAWGKIVGQPVYRLLGGACRPSVAVAHMVGLMSEEEAIAEALGAAADGIRALQIKGGVDPERDVRVVSRLAREFDGRVSLRLDANQGYRQVKRAVGVIARLAEHGLDFVEQPVEGLGRMAEVTRRVDVPVVADESCWDGADALEVVARGAADCLSIYLAKAGGIVGARRVAAIAASAGLRCDVNGSIESAIGNAANLHVALSSPAIDMPAVIPISAPAGRHPYRIGGNYYEDDVVAEPFPVLDGALLPLERPGLGIEVDEARLERYRCR